jgi:hypothetical protein
MPRHETLVRDGGTLGLMRRVGGILLLGLVACGGRTLVTPEGASGSGGSEPAESTSPPSAAPAVDSSACQMADGTCVLCADGKFHCNSEILLMCPPDINVSDSCAGAVNAGFGFCLTCANGIGTLWRCLPGDRWLMEPDSMCIQ